MENYCILLLLEVIGFRFLGCGGISFKGHISLPEDNTLNFIDTKISKHWTDFPSSHIDFKIQIPIKQDISRYNGEILDSEDKHIKLNYSILSFHKPQYYFTKFRNVYYRSLYSYYVDGSYYSVDFHAKTLDGNVTKTINKLVVITGFLSDKFFGDALVGGIVRIAYIPKNILEKSTFIYSNVNYREYYEEVLKIYNVSNFELEYIPPQDFIFARELFTILPTWRRKTRNRNEVNNGFYGDFIQQGFIKKVIEHYQLQNIEPSIYAVMQRDKGMMRCLQNFDEIFQMLKKEHSELNITRIPHGFDSFYSAALTMRSIRWLFGPTGSNIIYSIFMCPHTCVCMYMGDWLDYPIISCLISAKVHFVGFETNIYHFSHEEIYLDIERASKFVNYSLTLLQTEKLPMKLR